MLKLTRKRTIQEDFSDYKKGGYHPVEIGDLFESRYHIIKKLGWGVFSTVWLSYDEISHRYVALKISKSALFYSEAAASEINMLQDINERARKFDTNLPSANNFYTISLLDSFTHRGPNGRHVCMVFELLGLNLLEVLRIYQFQGIPLDICKSFFTQILTALDFLHRTCGIIHTDMKLENILLKLTNFQNNELMKYGEIHSQLRRRVERADEISRIFGRSMSEANVLKFRQVNINKENLNGPKSKNEDLFFSPKLEIRVVDFGNAVYASGTCNNEIQTREYRAPEVILGYKYTTAADMWSFGCIAYEMLTGEELFTPKAGNGYSEDDDHLAAIWELVGDFPLDWASRSLRGWRYFVNGGLRNIKELEFFMLKDMLIQRHGFKAVLAEEICSFLLPCLQIVPENRISARDCLSNPWLCKR